MTLAPFWRANSAPAGRFAATTVGAARASSSGSWPHWPPGGPASARQGPATAPPTPPAIPAREKKGPLAGIDQEARDRNRPRRLARTADRWIADTDDRNAG